MRKRDGKIGPPLNKEKKERKREDLNKKRSKGTLDLRIIVDGVYSDYITYTLITDEPQ